MFAYDYGIKKDDQGNKVLNLSVNLSYISAFEGIKTDDVELILNSYNPIGLLREKIREIHKEEF